MHLRSITLAGFKTFARPTEIAFDPGVTAIVGPNGAGKSNTVDAFKWVLGETQARDLRGRKMEDVIYAGGQRRPRASTAEAVIVIHNADHRLPLDYEEVSIRRRVDRSGRSDYFLNGDRVRRRDLLDLLASTGLTTDSYAIVDHRDVDSIVSSTPEQRRLLLEAAARVGGVKAKRNEAAAELEELARNLVRLMDLRGEIEPRLEVVRFQAAAAREAAEAQGRLELLRGSIVWEEWREARDAHRRAATQVQSLERRLEAAEHLADAAEADFRERRASLQAAQDRRLDRQRAIGVCRLDQQQAEHALALAEERARSHTALAEAARAEKADLHTRHQNAVERRGLLAGDLERAKAELAAVPEAPPAPRPGNAERAQKARQDADRAHGEVATAQAALTATRTRRELLEEQLVRLRQLVEPAEAALLQAEADARGAGAAAAAATVAATELGRLRAELEGLEALRPAPAGALSRVGDVIVAQPGYEAALSGVLGPLVDAWAAPDEAAADQAAATSADQVTVLYPRDGPEAERGSLLEHVTPEPGFERLARRLIGRVEIGRDVTADGVYREPGLVRAGSDPRVRLTARKRGIERRIADLVPAAAGAGAMEEEARRAGSRLMELRSAAAQRRRLDETAAQLQSAMAAESREAERVPELEEVAAAAELDASITLRAVDDLERAGAAHRAEAGRLDMERARWRERTEDLQRQLTAVDADLAGIEEYLGGCSARGAESERRLAVVEAELPGLRRAVLSARERVAAAERETPGEDLELASAAKLLITAEEARVEARLAASTLQGSTGVLRREVELAAARMGELRRRMPEGLAPEEVPGGKAREREMRQLERRLEEIGPTNALAATECAELEQRYGNLLGQLDDIAAARADLLELVGRLREEEETRYEAVFGAVAANFQEFFAELTAGGQATLSHAAGDDGPRSGVEILVQPPHKRLQNVSLLSSGERTLTALALVLALQEVNPAPFTILDEVDAPLDDANVARFGEILQRLGRSRQFMVITHNHLTMAIASALYGVHLDESGCSHLVSVRLEDVQPARRSQPAAQTA